jgi:hypothetical protein
VKKRKRLASIYYIREGGTPAPKYIGYRSNTFKKIKEDGMNGNKRRKDDRREEETPTY